MIKKSLPYLFLLLLLAVFFRSYFLKGLIPIPADIITGMYYPWHNSSWGQPTGVPVKNPLTSDIVSIIFEWKTLVLNQLKSGQFPFWNADYLLGMPLWANFQNSLVNITNLVFLLPLSLANQWSWLIISSAFLSLLFSYLLLKKLTGSSLAAIAGSAVYTFSLFTTVWLEYGVHPYVASFLPLIIYFSLTAIETKKLRNFCFLSLAVALQIYGGYPQYAIYTLLFTGVFLMLYYRRVFFDYLHYWLFFVILGVVLALPLLLPGYELIHYSINHLDYTALDSNGGFLPFKNLLTAIVPNFWGNPATYDYQGSGFYDNNAFYPGILAVYCLVFFLCSSFFKPKFKNHFLTLSLSIVAVAILLLVISNPMSQLIRTHFGLIIPTNGLATRLFFVTNFIFAYLVAVFISQFRHYQLRQHLLPALFLLVWIGLLIFTSLNHQPPLASPVSLKNCYYALVFVVITLLSVFLASWRRLKLPATFLALLLLIPLIVDLFYTDWKYLPFSPPQYLFPPTSTLQFLQKNAIGYNVAFADTIPQNMWLPYGLSSADGYDTLMPLTNFSYLSFVQNNHLATSAKRALTLTSYRSPLFSQTATKYIVALNPTIFSILKDNPSFKIVDQEGANSVLEIPTTHLKYYFPQSVKITQKSVISDLLTLSESQDLITSLHPQTQGNCQLNPLEVSVASANFYSFKSGNNCGRYLVLVDSNYPGWHATIDGQDVTVDSANYLFKAVYVPAGRHTITFYYRPLSFIIGLVAAGLALIIWLILFFRRR